MFGGGRHLAPDSYDDEPTSQFWVGPLDPDTEDETPTARFVLNSYRGLFDYGDDDAPTMRIMLNPYREVHDPFGANVVIEGEVVGSGQDSLDEPETDLYFFTTFAPSDDDSGWVAPEDEDDPESDDFASEEAYEEVYEEYGPEEYEEYEPEDAGRDELGPNTVAGATELIIRELAPSEMTRFPVIVERFFADEILQRRVIRWALSGAKRDDPVALQLGGPNAELVTALCLAMLTCAANGVLGHVGTRRHGGVARWRRNRGAARRRLSRGPATTLPHLSSIGTATVGQIVEEAAEDAGLTPDLSRRLSILILSALTRPVH